MGCLSSRPKQDSSPAPWSTPASFARDFPDDVSTIHLESVSSLLCGSSHTKGTLHTLPLILPPVSPGGREYMEDIDILFENLQLSSDRYLSLYGVFDGHGGRECAAHIAKYLPIRVISKLRDPHCHAPEEIYRAFLEVDQEWIQLAVMDTNRKDAGSTATLLVWDFKKNIAYIANVGDTRAVLCRDGQALDMTIDHKASDPEVVEAVNSRGGFVANGRINGILGTHPYLFVNGVVTVS